MLSSKTQNKDADGDSWVVVNIRSQTRARSIPASNQIPTKISGRRDSRDNTCANSKESCGDAKTTNKNGSIVVTPDQIDQYRRAFESDPSAEMAQNALTSASVWTIGKSHKAILQQQQEEANSDCLSIDLDGGHMPVTNQKSSGRCWLFGMLNLLRFDICKTLNVKSFEFSEAYLYFFHLLEQANSYCENVIETAHLPVDDRLASQIIDDSPVQDGGDWGIAVQLLHKYGILPKSCYPETRSSGNTGSLRSILKKLLRRSAVLIRSSLAKGVSKDDVRSTIKADTVQHTYRILCCHLGTPPATFDWKWRDKQGTCHRVDGMAPLDFVAKYISIPYMDYVSAVQDPRNDYYRVYFSKFNMPVHEAPPIHYLNLPADEIKSLALQQLQNGLPVVFACNDEVDEDGKYAFWDSNLYALSNLYGGGIPLDEKLSKKHSIEYGGSLGDHIMLITGVDLCESTGKPLRWRVENSWGSDSGNQDGYYTMHDNWFDANIYEVIGPPSYLSPQAAAGLNTDPIELPAWDKLQETMRKRV